MKKFNEILKEYAFWISPQGKVNFLTNGETHIEQVIKNPGYFGYTKSMIQNIYNKHNEKLGSEGNAREEIIKNLIRKGWVRIRKYNRPDYWSVNVPNLNNRIKDALQGWSSYILKHGASPYSDVRLDIPTGMLNYTVTDLSNDALYLNENIKVPGNRFLLDFSEGVRKKKMYKKFFKESSLSRIWKHVTLHDSGTISAFRYAHNCGEGETYTKNQNENKNAKLKAQLLSLGYGVTAIDGVYIENYNTSNAIEVREESFIAIDLKDKGTLKKDLIKLGTLYKQDSITYSKPKGDYYLISRNACPNVYPFKWKIVM